MELNEIKKILYRLKLTARHTYTDDDGKRYIAQWGSASAEPSNTQAKTNNVHFLVPHSEISKAEKDKNPESPSVFQDQMPAQLLIRYIIEQ